MDGVKQRQKLKYLSLNPFLPQLNFIPSFPTPLLPPHSLGARGKRRVGVSP